MKLCNFCKEFATFMSNFEKFKIFKFQSAIMVPDFHLAAKILPSWYSFWPVEYKSGEKNNLLSKQGPNHAILWFKDPPKKINLQFFLFFKNIFCLKGKELDFIISKNHDNRSKNGVMAAKNVKFWFFALWGWNFKKCL